MTVKYTEKRDFIRMNTDSMITYKEVGEKEAHQGQCINLSAAGVLFTSAHKLPLGSMVEIKITPELSLTGPLNATIQIVRTQAQANGQFAVAGQIKSFL